LSVRGQKITFSDFPLGAPNHDRVYGQSSRLVFPPHDAARGPFFLFGRVSPARFVSDFSALTSLFFPARRPLPSVNIAAPSPLPNTFTPWSSLHTLPISAHNEVFRLLLLLLPIGLFPLSCIIPSIPLSCCSTSSWLMAFCERLIIPCVPRSWHCAPLCLPLLPSRFFSAPAIPFSLLVCVLGSRWGSPFFLDSLTTLGAWFSSFSFYGMAILKVGVVLFPNHASWSRTLYG